MVNRNVVDCKNTFLVKGRVVFLPGQLVCEGLDQVGYFCQKVYCIYILSNHTLYKYHLFYSIFPLTDQPPYWRKTDSKTRKEESR